LTAAMSFPVFRFVWLRFFHHELLEAVRKGSSNHFEEQL